jgi:hypothetical protein
VLAGDVCPPLREAYLAFQTFLKQVESVALSAGAGARHRSRACRSKSGTNNNRVKLRDILPPIDPSFLEGHRPLSGGRDCPLLFNYAIDPDFLESALAALGVALPNSRERRIALNHLVTEAVIALASERWLSYSRRTN